MVFGMNRFSFEMSREWVELHGLTFPVLYDPDPSETYWLYAHNVLPQNTLTDRHFEVIHDEEGAYSEAQMEPRIVPPRERLQELLLPGHAGFELESGTGDLTPVHAIDDDLQDPIAILRAHPDDARIESRRVPIHPLLDLLARGQVTLAAAR